MATTSAVNLKAKSDPGGSFKLDEASHTFASCHDFLRRVKHKHGIDIMGNVASRSRRQQYLEVYGTHIGTQKPAMNREAVDARCNQSDLVFRPESAHQINNMHVLDQTSIMSTGGTSRSSMPCHEITENGTVCTLETPDDGSTSDGTSCASTPSVWKTKHRGTDCTDTVRSMMIMSTSTQIMHDAITIDTETSNTKPSSGRTMHFNMPCDTQSMPCNWDSEPRGEPKDIFSIQGDFNGRRIPSKDSSLQFSPASVTNRSSPVRKHSPTIPCVSSSLTTATTKEDTAKAVKILNSDTKHVSKKAFQEINQRAHGVSEYENLETDYTGHTKEHTHARYEDAVKEETIRQCAWDFASEKKAREEATKPSGASQPQRTFTHVQNDILPSDSFTSMYAFAYAKQSWIGTDILSTDVPKVPSNSEAETSLSLTLLPILSCWRESRTAPAGDDAVTSDTDCRLTFDASNYRPVWSVHANEKDTPPQTPSSVSTICGHIDYAPHPNILRELVQYESEDKKPASALEKETKIVLPIPAPPPFRLDKEAMKNIYLIGQSCMLNFVKELRLKLSQEKEKHKRTKRAQQKARQEQEKHRVPRRPDHDSSTLVSLNEGHQANTSGSDRTVVAAKIVPRGVHSSTLTAVHAGVQANNSRSERSVVRTKIVRGLHSKTFFGPKRKKEKNKRRAILASKRDTLETDLPEEESPADYENPAEPALTTLKLLYLQPSGPKRCPTNLLPTYNTAVDHTLGKE